MLMILKFIFSNASLRNDKFQRAYFILFVLFGICNPERLSVHLQCTAICGLQIRRYGFRITNPEERSN
ncbi:MAG: hypothetical protein QM610_15240, partial [Chitinophagaceae bacterium]